MRIAVLGGTVSDATGAVMNGVTVTARNVNTGIVSTNQSNDTGNYNFPSLQPGQYTVTATMSGFQTATYTNLSLGQGENVRQNFTLQIASATTSIEVVEEAPTISSTTTASVGAVLSERAVATLPLQQWVHVTVTSDGSSKAAGLRIYVDGRPAEVEVVREFRDRRVLPCALRHDRRGQETRGEAAKRGRPG